MLMAFCFPFIAQASLLSSELKYDYYQSWRQSDQLYYSTFNSGEQWKPWPAARTTFDNLNLVDQLNLCFAHGGGWNHYLGECVIEDEDKLVDYLEAVEETQRFGFHFSAPALNLETETDLASIDPKTLDWSTYERWSPEKQLFFSSLSQGEQGGTVIPWQLDKY